MTDPQFPPPGQQPNTPPPGEPTQIANPVPQQAQFGQPQQFEQPQAQFGQPANFQNNAAQSTSNGGSKIAMRIGMVFATLAIIGGGAFAAWKVFIDTDKGEDTPEAAAEQFFEALGSEDPLGIIEVMLPSEREALLDPSFAIAEQLSRLNIFSDKLVENDQFNINESLQFETTEITYAYAPLGEDPYSEDKEYGEDVNTDIQAVVITGGELKITADPDKFGALLGDRLADASDDLSDEKVETVTYTFSKTGIEFTDENGDIEEVSADPLRLVAVKEDGGYHISLWYTFAEYARTEAGSAIPDFSERLVAAGATTPEEAVENMIKELTNFNFEGMMSTMDPDEFRVLYDYWSLYGDDISSEFDSLVTRDSDGRINIDGEDLSWRIDEVYTKTEERNGRTVVTIGGAKGNLAVLDNSTDMNIDFDFKYGKDENFLKISGYIKDSLDEVDVKFSIELTDTNFNIDISGEFAEYPMTATAKGTITDGVYDGTANLVIEDVTDTSTTPEVSINPDTGELETIEPAKEEPPYDVEVNVEFKLDSNTLDGSGSAVGNFNAVDEISTYEIDFGIDSLGCFKTTITEDGDPSTNTDCSIDFGFFLDYQESLDDLSAKIPTPGVTVVKHDDGLWYVSGVPTMLYSAADFLSAVEEDDFDRWADIFDEAYNQVYYGSSPSTVAVDNFDFTESTMGTAKFESTESTITLDPEVGDANSQFNDTEFSTTTVDLTDDTDFENDLKELQELFESYDSGELTYEEYLAEYDRILGIGV